MSWLQWLEAKGFTVVQSEVVPKDEVWLIGFGEGQ